MSENNFKQPPLDTQSLLTDLLMQLREQVSPADKPQNLKVVNGPMVLTPEDGPGMATFTYEIEYYIDGRWYRLDVAFEKQGGLGLNTVTSLKILSYKGLI